MKTTESASRSVRAKWKILAKAITKNRKKESSISNSFERCTDESAHQILRFPSYNLIHYKVLAKANLLSRAYSINECEQTGISEDSDEERRTWYQTVAHGYSAVNLKISCLKPTFTLHEINGFNNTGNVCIWPAEECLSIFCLDNPHYFNNKLVIELGAGMTGLAGLIVAQVCGSQKVTLTDGNEASVRNLDAIIKENDLFANVKAQVFKWDDIDKHSSMQHHFDIAICADCLFFDTGRPQLIKCLSKILKPNGIAIIVAPRRSGTVEHFVDLMNNEKSNFNPVKVDLQYSKQIWLRRQELINYHSAEFNEDTDYPVMLLCKRK